MGCWASLHSLTWCTISVHPVSGSVHSGFILLSFCPQSGIGPFSKEDLCLRYAPDLLSLGDPRTCQGTEPGPVALYARPSSHIDIVPVAALHLHPTVGCRLLQTLPPSTLTHHCTKSDQLPHLGFSILHLAPVWKQLTSLTHIEPYFFIFKKIT